MRWRAEVLAIDGAGSRPGGALGELVLANLVGGQRGGPRGAAEEGGEMGDPAGVVTGRFAYLTVAGCRT